MAKSKKNQKSAEASDKIPSETLNDFLVRNCKIQEGSLFKINDTFLWCCGDIERHRVDVWVKKYNKKDECVEQYIGRSFFLHYDRDNNKLADRTVKKEKTRWS